MPFLKSLNFEWFWYFCLVRKRNPLLHTPLLKIHFIFRFSKKFLPPFLKWYYLYHSLNSMPTMYCPLLLHKALVIRLNKTRIHAFMELHSGWRYLPQINNILYHAQHHERTAYCNRKEWGETEVQNYLSKGQGRPC